MPGGGGGWRVVESGPNRKPKWRKQLQEMEEDDTLDENFTRIAPVPGARLVSDATGPYAVSSYSKPKANDSDDFASRLDSFLSNDVSTGRLMTAEEWSSTNKKSSNGPGVFKQMERQKNAAKNEASIRAEKVQKQKEERKAKQEAQEQERARREDGKEQARLRNTPSEWPTLTECLDANAKAVMAGITSALGDDPILRSGGIGAFFVYIPSLLDSHTIRTQTPDGVLTGERLLLEAVVEDGDSAGAQKVVQHITDNVISAFGGMTLGSTEHNAQATTAIVDGVVGLLSNVYGAKGSKIILPYCALQDAVVSTQAAAAPTSGNGAELALQIAISRVAPVILENLDSFLPVFLSAANTAHAATFHSHASRVNFINFIRCVLVNAKVASSAKERTSRTYFLSEERMLALIARTAASLLISGALGELIKSSRGAAVEEVFLALQQGVRFVSGAIRGDNAAANSEAVLGAARGAYTKLQWKALTGEAGADVSAASAKKALSSLFAAFSTSDKHFSTSSTRFFLVSELVCRQNTAVAKAAIAPLLEVVEAAMAATDKKFVASSSPAVAFLFSCCVAFPTACVPAWRAAAESGHGKQRGGVSSSSTRGIRYLRASLLLRSFLTQATVLPKDQQAALIPVDFHSKLDAAAAEAGTSASSTTPDLAALTKQVRSAPVAVVTTGTKGSAAAPVGGKKAKSAAAPSSEVAAPKEQDSFPWFVLIAGIVGFAGVVAFAVRTYSS